MKDIELYRDSFQNFRSYQLPKAQLIIADVPYNLGKNAYASNPAWYKDGDNKNGESELAGKSFSIRKRISPSRVYALLQRYADKRAEETWSIPLHDNILRIRTTVHVHRTWSEVRTNEIHSVGIP